MDQTERIQSLYETTLRPRIEALEGLRVGLRTTILKAGILVAIPPDILISLLSFALLLVALVAAFQMYFMPAFTASANYKTRFKKEVYIGKIGSHTLMNPSASPILRSEDEARWIAAEIRRALR
jgi:hypothetical protein